MSSLPDKLKRRGVLRVALAYLAIAWLILQVLDVVGSIVQLPDWLLKISLIALIVCLPVALVLAWARGKGGGKVPGLFKLISDPGTFFLPGPIGSTERHRRSTSGARAALSLQPICREFRQG